MSAVGVGAIAGGALAGVSSMLSLRSQNKEALRQIESASSSMLSSLKQVNINRDLIDRDLGDFLTDNALATAKNMATATLVMSGSGTIGGTTAQVGKQAYIEQMRTDADIIKQSRNRDIEQLNLALSKQIEFRSQSNAIRSNIKSPLEAFIGTTSAIINGGSQGASMGSSFASITK